MILRTLNNFLFFILFFCSASLYGMIEHDKNDLKTSKIRPIISGIKDENTIQDIIEGRKAVITVCTTPLKNKYWSFLDVDHVALVFEFKNVSKKEINLCTVHFGGDGQSEVSDKKRPIIDNASETLKKVYRRKKTTTMSTEYLKPIYTRAAWFLIDYKDAMKALENVENDKNLDYAILAKTWGILPNYDNCCTYANKVLVDAGIDVAFNKSIKNTGNLIKCCEIYSKNNDKAYIFPKNQEVINLELDLIPINVEEEIKKENNITQNLQNLFERPNLFSFQQNNTNEFVNVTPKIPSQHSPREENTKIEGTNFMHDFEKKDQKKDELFETEEGVIAKGLKLSTTLKNNQSDIAIPQEKNVNTQNSNVKNQENTGVVEKKEDTLSNMEDEVVKEEATQDTGNKNFPSETMKEINLNDDKDMNQNKDN